MKSTAKFLIIVMALGAPMAIPHTLMAAAETGSTPTGPLQGRGMAMMPMQQQMMRMQAEMAKIHDTKDPKERRELMREHAASMHSMMHGMMATVSQ
ncbi:MAG: hypothetical protein QNM00_09535 [Gammaproteobacteria bacterium]|nr:hypothetical protein [Gammaproteobacteria bacterium]